MSEEVKVDSQTMPDEDKEIEELRRKRREGGRGGVYAKGLDEYSHPLDLDALREQDPQETPRFRMVNTVEEGPDPSEINLRRRIKLHGKLPTWLFWTIIGVIGIGFPAIIFISFMLGK